MSAKYKFRNQEIPPNGNILETDYDELGRLEKRTVKEAGEIGEEHYDYEYYETGPEETFLKKETAPSGHATEYTYDNDQNIASITEIIDGQPYTTTFEYDAYGKPTRKEYPSGFAIRYEYDNKAYLERITSDDGQLIIWEITGGNAQGQVTNYNLGNGLVIENDYDDNFFPKSTTAENGGNTVFSFEYDFDAVTGNLKSRNLHGTEEHFYYDTDGKQLNRLAGTGPDENTVSETYAFADNGNIANKAGIGPYLYHSQKKNAVVTLGMPAVGGSPVPLQQVVYNHFNSASEIKHLEDDLELMLEYGPDQQRRRAVYENDGAPLKTRIYAGSYEKQINADNSEIEVHYIFAGGILVAMYVMDSTEEPEQGENPGKMYYTHQDHLGSIIHVSDDSGDIVETFSYDAWGRPRSPDDLSYSNIPERPEWLWRGYTGHEHLDEFGLINMNGRLYDPVVGRMLSPDNYVQSPDFSQSYNRYSYVWNNPLKYHDPDGELVWFAPVIVGAVVGQYIGGALANNSLNPFSWDYSSSDTWVGMGAGAVIGAAAGYAYAGIVGAKGVAAFMTPALSKKAFGAAVGGTINTLSHHDSKEGIGWHSLGYFAAGAVGSFVGIHAESPIAGFNLGGIANAGYSAAIGDIELDGYQLVQRYVSGGLSSMAGVKQLGITGDDLVGGSSHFIPGKSKFVKLTNKFLTYGIQSTAYDFAFSSQNDFTKRTLLAHFTIFASGGIAGTIMYESSTGVDNLIGRSPDYTATNKMLLTSSKSVMTLGALMPDWISAGRSKANFQGQYAGGSQQKKTGLSLLKSLLIGLRY